QPRGAGGRRGPPLEPLGRAAGEPAQRVLPGRTAGGDPHLLGGHHAARRGPPARTAAVRARRAGGAAAPPASRGSQTASCEGCSGWLSRRGVGGSAGSAVTGPAAAL